MKRRALALLLAAGMLAGMFTVSAGAADIIASGDCGYTMGMYNVTWTLDSSGVLTITGEGDMEYWVNSGYTDWIDYRSTILTASIGDGVTDVAPYCFYGCVNLTEVSLAATIDTINSGAFQNCTSLTEILIPDAVTSIGTYAFSGCTSLTEITIPDGVTQLDMSLFAGCTSLTTVNLPDSVTTMKSSVFSGCTALTDIVITEYITSISSSAFAGCTGLTEVTIPDTVTSVGNNAFRSCTGLTSVTVGSGTASLGSNAFAGCSALREIYFTGSAPAIGDNAFEGVTATIYYPASDDSWTCVGLQDYGGNITWTAYGDEADSAAVSFTDDTGTGSWLWASDYIYACQEAGLISAYDDGSFQPDTDVTRAVLVESLYRLAGSPAVSGSSSFSDVASGSTYEAAVIWASQNGIVSGYADGTFGPDDSVTREQMAAFFQRYAAYAGRDTSEAADLSGYTDAGSISSYAVSAMQWANAAGLINGRSETTLVPAGTTTRAEAAKILITFCSWLDPAV